jgi:uncharacterized protein YyaL (SSP411 family)
MKRESFEDNSTAKIMNENYVSIKVDREERPDIDEIYIKAVVSLAGNGGWPLSVFLTPDLKPFFGGTYYPPVDRYGLPGFRSVLSNVLKIWLNNKSEIDNVAEKIFSNLQKKDVSSSYQLSSFPLDAAYAVLVSQFDSIYGGFGSSPKFPTPSLLIFLTRYYVKEKKEESLSMVKKTLTSMGRGGIFDQLAGGFHRYSVDRYWLIPHFEKMLYDNALLPLAYLEAWKLTQEPLFADITRKTLDWVLREMWGGDGGFYSSQDAESEGEEGKYYAWDKSEITKLLCSKDTEVFNLYYGISERGNFEKRNILYVAKEKKDIAEDLNISLSDIEKYLNKSSKILLSEREKRIKPNTDDKVIVSWNGLMISALSKAYQIFEDKRYLKAAEISSQFILSNMFDGEKLLRRWRDGEPAIEGLLEDYAFLVMGLLDLYESNFDEKILSNAIILNKTMMNLFADEQAGGFYSTHPRRSDIIARIKDATDGATLSSNGVTALNIAKIAEFTSDDKMRKSAEKTILSFWDKLETNPEQSTQMLCALDFIIGNPKEIVLAGDMEGLKEMLREIRNRPMPNKVVSYSPTENSVLSVNLPILEGKIPINKKPTVYICQNYTCKSPVTDMDSLKKQLN